MWWIFNLSPTTGFFIILACLFVVVVAFIMLFIKPGKKSITALFVSLPLVPLVFLLGRFSFEYTARDTLQFLESYYQGEEQGETVQWDGEALLPPIENISFEIADVSDQHWKVLLVQTPSEAASYLSVSKTGGEWFLSYSLPKEK